MSSFLILMPFVLGAAAAPAGPATHAIPRESLLASVVYKPKPFPRDEVYIHGKKMARAKWFETLLMRGHVRVDGGVLAPKRYRRQCAKAAYADLVLGRRVPVNSHVRLYGHVNQIVPGGFYFGTQLKDDVWTSEVGVLIADLRLGDKLKDDIRGTLYGRYLGLVHGVPIVAAKTFEFERPKIKLEYTYDVTGVIDGRRYTLDGTAYNKGNRALRSVMLEARAYSGGALLSYDYYYLGDLDRDQSAPFAFTLYIDAPRRKVRFVIQPVSGEYVK